MKAKTEMVVKADIERVGVAEEDTEDWPKNTQRPTG